MHNLDTYVKADGRSVKIADLIDKVLFTRKGNVPIYRNFAAQPVYMAVQGASLGKLHAAPYDYAQPNTIWLMFYDNASPRRPYYVKYTDDLLSLSQLTGQGVKPLPNAAEQAAEAAKPKDFGGATYSLLNTALWGGLILGGVYVYNQSKSKR